MHVNGRLVCLLLMMILLAATPGRVMAQGTSGTVPDPISTKDLLDFGKRLKLSGQQVTAVQAMHDEYKREFRTLREGEIAELLKDMRDMQGNGMMPGRDAVKKFLDQTDLVNRRISEVDNRLFDQITTVLTPEQQAVMPRIKQARQRDRYSAQQMMWMTGGPPVDLVDGVVDLALTPDEFLSVDAVLSPYESRLTSELSKLYDMTSRMIMTMYDAMEKAGLNEKSFEDPETAQQAGEQMQAIWQDMTAKSQAVAKDITDLNRRTAKSILAVLPPDPARELRQWVHGRMYPESGIHPGQTETMFTHALKLDPLSVTEREAVLAAQSAYSSALNQLMDDAATLIDNFREKQNIFDYDQEVWQTHQNELVKLQGKNGEIAETAAASLTAALGEERAGKITQLVQAIASENEKESSVAEMPVGGGDDAEFNAELAGGDDEMVIWGADQFLPPRIGARELVDYMTLLKLDDEQRTTAQQMYKEYQESWRALETDGAIHALQKQQTSLWQHNGDEQPKGPTTAQLDETYRLRRAALDAIMQTDKSFLDDMEMAVLNAGQAPIMARVRLWRERICYNRGDVLSWMSDGAQESSIDLVRLVQRQRLHPDHLTALDPILQKYEKDAVDVVKARYDASMAYMRAQEQWNVEASSVQDENGMDFGRRYRALLEVPLRAAGEADGMVSELNRTTLTALTEALPAAEAYALRREYNKRAFPTIYQDGTALERQLDEALRLGDLTDEQRRIVTDLIAEYRPAYEALCEQMVSHTSTQPNINRAFGWEGEEWQKMQEQQEVMEKMRFDRNELNQRAVARLKAALTEDQIKRIGGLPEPQEDEGFGMWK